MDREIWLVNWHIGKHQFYTNFYTRVDQACLLWSLLILSIFAIGQFFAIDWQIQGVLWTIVSLIGLAMMTHLARRWACIRRVSWLLHCWVILILTGLLLTNLSIFMRWGQVLINLCALWLGLCAVGYLCSGLALHSYCFVLTSLLHLFAMWVLPYIGGFQFLFTGMVMVIFLVLLAEFQWDMRTQKVT